MEVASGTGGSLCMVQVWYVKYCQEFEKENQDKFGKLNFHGQKVDWYDAGLFSFLL